MRKGISQLITAILLIGITVMIAGIMANWLFKLSAGQAGIIEAKGGEIRCHFAGLAVSDVNYNCSSNILSLNVANTGDKTLTDFKFMIILENTSVVTIQAEGALNPQEIAEFSIQAPNALEYDKLFFLSQTCPTIARVDISPGRIEFIEPGLCGVPAVVYFLTVSAEPETIKFSDGVCKSNITANLTDSTGAPIAGQAIEFSSPSGTVLSSKYVLTNASGIAKTNLTIYNTMMVSVIANTTIGGIATGGNVNVLCTSDNTPPTSVTNLHWTGNTTPILTYSTTIILNWTAATDESGIKEYKIYIWENQNSSGYVYFGTNTSATGYSFTGEDGKNYSANVTAVDNVNNENTTGTVTDTVLTVNISLDPDLVLYLKFDENEGTLAKDSSSYGNDGTLYNGSVICSGGDCPTWKSGVDCKSGSCLEFDGINDFVDCGDKFDFYTTGTTYSFWIRPVNLSVDHYMMSKYNVVNGATFFFGLTNAYLGNIDLAFETNTATVGETLTLTVGTWYHVVATVDTSANNYRMKMYLNGVERGMPVTTTKPDTLGYNFVIGQINNEDFFNGTIDEVKIYNRALSPDEIMAHYESQ